MFNIVSDFNKNATKKPLSRQLAGPKKKSTKKLQASKTLPRDAVELEWIKKVANKRNLSGFLVLAVILTLSYILHDKDMLPVHKIRVSGDYQQLNKKHMNEYLQTYLGSSFFSIDIKSIQQTISKQPWVDTVSVKRIWPDQLQVTLKEKQAVARWDKGYLLSNRAVIFAADDKRFIHLPRIKGYSGNSLELLQRYRLMQQEFSKQEIVIAEMTEDNKGALRLVLNQDLKVNIGSENNELKIKHLLAIYPHQIKPNIEQIKHIDFRYSNGFAIAWKDEFLRQQSGNLKKRGNKNV